MNKFDKERAERNLGETWAMNMLFQMYISQVENIAAFAKKYKDSIIYAENIEMVELMLGKKKEKDCDRENLLRFKKIIERIKKLNKAESKWKNGRVR